MSAHTRVDVWFYRFSWVADIITVQVTHCTASPQCVRICNLLVFVLASALDVDPHSVLQDPWVAFANQVVVPFDNAF